MSDVDRRRFLARSLTTLGAGGVGAAAGALAAGGAGAGLAQAATTGDQAQTVALDELDIAIPFDGEHQAGILEPKPGNATLIAFDCVSADGEGLFEALQALTVLARQLTQGSTVGLTELDDPPPDSGILGSYNAPDSLTITVGFGASLFDDRFGLAARRPSGLTDMAAFEQDDLDPTITGGDLIVQIWAGQRDTVIHAIRQLRAAVAGHLAVRWTIDGFQAPHRAPAPKSTPRNLFAFRDGTGNPDTSDDTLMNQLLWLRDGDAAPAWTAGGTFMVVRRIRMYVEFWDRVGMLEQEQMIGRYRVSGAPLGGTTEFENPDYASDPKGERIPLDAHIRLANPRTQPTADQRILRRGFSYNLGVDQAGDLDQGLCFIAFNKSIQKQYEVIQRRLETEPMIDYIKLVGGGYFFVPRGTTGPGDWLGSGLAST